MIYVKRYLEPSMSEPTHLFVCVVLLRTFPYSNSSQICELNMFPKNQCLQILRTHIPFARIYSRLNPYFYVCLTIKIGIFTYFYVHFSQKICQYLFVFLRKYSFLYVFIRFLHYSQNKQRYWSKHILDICD